MKKFHAVVLVLVLSGLISGCLAQTREPPAEKSPESGDTYIDVHTHITPGNMPLEEIIRNMDSEGIDRMVIMESPTDIYSGKPQSDFGIPEASEKFPDRFISLYGGEAITMLYSAAAQGNYTRADEERYSALLEDAMKSGKYWGFGEIALLHFASEDGTNITVPGDHPWMFLMSDIAARHDVPIDIHMEATDESIAGLEKLLDYNNSTKIIWEHAGRSNTGKVTPELMKRLMEKHPNLYSAIKIRKPTTPERIAVRILDDDGKIMPGWMALFKEFPDRLMVGSDIKPGEKEGEFDHIKNNRKLLRQMPPEIRKKIGRENAERVFRIK